MQLAKGKSGRRARVLVAMSGGVDSSVAAGLMARQSYDVVGVTLQLYDHGAAVNKKGACCAGQDIHDARRVAERLGIPHYVLDYEDRFRRAVMDDFADAYTRGETPIPCVRCNQRIKFGDLLELAREIGAEMLATGHYVRRIDTQTGPELHRPADVARDQSYFLFATTREQLAQLTFPLGDLPKAQVREIARELQLPTAEKQDSQDICFVPQGRYADVVRKMRPAATEPGDIVDQDGNVLGTHSGIINFTVGQRKGLGLSGNAAPLFVTRIDAATRRVVVGPRGALREQRILLSEVNWLGAQGIRSVSCAVKVRSTRPPAAAKVELYEDGTAEVRLLDGGDTISPGQACVFYESGGTRVLGGGWIQRQPARKLASLASGAIAI
jgi:tRNA-uridine 2-sulfurtransferase